MSRKLYSDILLQGLRKAPPGSVHPTLHMILSEEQSMKKKQPKQRKNQKVKRIRKNGPPRKGLRPKPDSASAMDQIRKIVFGEKND